LMSRARGSFQCPAAKASPAAPAAPCMKVRRESILAAGEASPSGGGARWTGRTGWGECCGRSPCHDWRCICPLRPVAALAVERE
jgi:hypothetical protein